MNFNSAEFLIFYPIVLLLHFLLPLKVRWIALLAVSYYFYMTWNPSLIFLILFNMLSTDEDAKAKRQQQREKARARRQHAKEVEK